MKRIMLLTIVILLVVPNLTKGYYGYSSVRYRTRWSPYVHGLVSGDVHYSPYAFKYGHSGLVSNDFHYSPYAFKYGRSGLVYDSWYSYTFRRVLVSSCQPQNSFKIKRHYRKKKVATENDEKQVIYNYLRARNIGFRPIDGYSGVNVDLLLKDKNLIIRYQNSEEAQSLEKLPEDNYKRRFYKGYEERTAHLSGPRVYMINASDEKGILAALMLCPDL